AACPGPCTQCPCRRCPAFPARDSERYSARSSPQRAFKKQSLKRLVVRTVSAQRIAGLPAVRLRRLWSSHYRQHASAFAVGIGGRSLFLLQNDALVAHRANHRAVGISVLFQEPVKAHHAPAAHRNPHLLGTFWAHAPLSQSKSAKYIPEPRL